ncbi:MAG: NUDIX domain-containing protein [Defluviitaleaceae bacterium]|nr:NUDIX domain-containing protein [Defluviitaleaceae bacterium]
MTEIWDIYDSNRIKTGRTRTRGEEQAAGEYATVAMVLIFNTAGQMLIQQRAGHLRWAPGKWTMTAGGLVESGETSAVAAGRELCEELGIQMDFTGQRPNFSMTNEGAFIDYFVVTADVDITAIKMPKEDVQAVKWATQEEMLAMIDQGHCVPYRRGFLEFCFDGGKVTDDMV